MKRTIARTDIGTRVFVYWNLHSNTFSIKSLSTGRVIGHADYVQLTKATGRVSQAGRERVLREGRKNVHAGIVGTLAGTDTVVPAAGVGEAITYNPKQYARFVFVDRTEVEWTDTREIAWLHNRRVTVAGESASGLY